MIFSETILAFFATKSKDATITKRNFSRVFHYLGHIMTAISDFATKQAEYSARIDAALTGLSADVDTLSAKVAELQATSGAITAEDQALLDQIDAQVAALATRIEAADALTPPAAPTNP
jgi:hypothetical protein